MKVLLINGGPHKDGCTNLALEEIQKTLEKHEIETEILWLGTNPIRGCIGCNHCYKEKTNRCVIEDGMINSFLEKAEKADGFVFGSPVHFAAATGQITSFLDRALYGKWEIFSGKVCANIVSCRRAGSTAALDQLNKYALVTNMYLVGSSYWNMIHGNKKEEAQQDLEGLQTMRNLGENMAYLLKALNLAEKNNIDKPYIDKGSKTNFIR